MTSNWGPLRSFLVLSPLLLFVPLHTYYRHSALPTPLTELTDPVTNLPQISETRILGFAEHLSEAIGYRTVGSKEHALADEWMFEQARIFKEECDKLAGLGRQLECEIWHQRGSGSHRFDMMGKQVFKTYIDLTNIIVRVSDGTAKGKQHAILVNAHLDSTLPSPGAADDAISVGVMLECMRVLIQTPDYKPDHAIIFLFNHAEESLQDGSHLYSTQHPTASTVRAAINLEAAGSTGRELLFQATSEEMLRAYASVPRPYGSIFANEIFSSGVILSDTDFRQFEEYLNVTGLDMAIVGNSYLYHMRKDIVENIEPGVAQHMAENALALFRYLTSAETSPLPALAEGAENPNTVFFEHFGFFISYSFAKARILNIALLLSSLAIVSRYGFQDIGNATKILATTFIGAVLGANVVALLMSRVLGKGMSWFAHEYSVVPLFAPPALCGALAMSLIFPDTSERALYGALLLFQSTAAVAGQFAGVGSSVLYFVLSYPVLAGLIFDTLARSKERVMSLWSYVIGMGVALMAGTQLMLSILDFFTPLTGRIGPDAPADHIVATIVSVITTLSIPLLVPFSYRFPRSNRKTGVVALAGLSALAMAVFYNRNPFDPLHQKRLFVLHIENITSSETHLHVAAADAAPGFPQLVHDIAEVFAPESKVEALEMNDYNADWDPLYPFSQFLHPFKMHLPSDTQSLSGHTFSVTAVKDTKDLAAGTRSLTLQITHPGIIWTVIAFDAHILEWNLDSPPLDYHTRYHVKEASFYGRDVWTLDLVIVDSELQINFMGLLERGYWPGKKGQGSGISAMNLFETFDSWIDAKTDGTVDAMLMGCVAGVATV